MRLKKDLTKPELELLGQDQKLGELILGQPSITHKPRKDYFFSLCRSIISQQVSVAAARTIFGRFEEVTGLEPKKVAALSEKQVKQIGLSRQKAGYLKDLAGHFVANPRVYNHLEKLTDEEVIADLTAVKGIGIWTAQMFLMFTLTRPDVFAPDDVGIQRAMKNLYGWKTINKEKMEKTAAKWRPYRTTACYHLWHSLRNSPE